MQQNDEPSCARFVHLCLKCPGLNVDLYRNIISRRQRLFPPSSADSGAHSLKMTELCTANHCSPNHTKDGLTDTAPKIVH